jgi:hypothetical protein
VSLKGATLAIAAVTMVFGLVSCAPPIPPKVDFSESARNFRAEDYPNVFKLWSRHSKVISDQGTVIEAWALYKSWEWRQAYIERYAKVYNLTDSERQTLYRSQLEALRAAYEFHVTVQTTNYKWNDLDKETSPWRVSLVDARGAEVAPKRIEPLRLPELYEMDFFPNKTEFTRTYVIRFARADADAVGFTGPGSGLMTLRFASPVARAEAAWQSK